LHEKSNQLILAKTTTMKKRFLFLFIICINLFGFSQEIKPFIGAGYNFSYSALRGINRFLDAYNRSPVHGTGFNLIDPFKHVTGLNGHNIVIGVTIDQNIAEINWTRKFDYSTALFSPYARRDVGFKTRTFGLGYFVPVYKYPNLSLNVYGGFHMDFIKARLLTKVAYSEAAFDTLEWKELSMENGRGNFSMLSPTLKLVFTPFKNVPVSFCVSTYWQMCWKNHDFSEMDSEMPNNWPSVETYDSLKSSGGNVGVVFQIVYAPGFKKSEREPKRKIIDEPVVTDVVLSGIIKDEATNLPVTDANIKIEKFADGKWVEIISMKSGATGDYNIRIPKGLKYRVSASSFGYNDKSEEFLIEDYSPSEYKKDLLLSKFKTGESITLQNIYFKKASAVLLEESFPELDKLFSFLKNNPSVEIEIAGHTSSEGDDDYNLKLSKERAESIAAYLITKGIDKTRMTPVGYGEKFPKVEEKTEDDRKLNRRVEFKILKQ